MKVLPEKDIKRLREELDSSVRPLFLFDDDMDGLCSFILLYRKIKDGKGVIVKSDPIVDEKFLRKVDEYSPDKIFILDMPLISQEFIDKAKVPIIWIDHHQLQQMNNLTYFNPRKYDNDAYIPTTRICYEIVKENIWIAACGCVADWYYPDFIEEFKRLYPDLIGKEKSIAELMYDSRLGLLIKVISFNLKGKVSDVNKIIRIMTRIEDPYEILDGKSPAGRLILKRFNRMDAKYKELLDDALNIKADKGVVLFKYNADRFSFTSDLAGELLYRNKDKVVIIAREKDGEMKCSIRGPEIDVSSPLENSLRGIEGRGGGHKYACGAVISSEDFDLFLRRFKEELGKV